MSDVDGRGRPDELIFDYRLEHRIPLDRAPTRHLERWVVSISVDDTAPAEPPKEIGSANVLIVAEPPIHVLLLDRVWLRPDYRGEGLGPIIAAAVIDRLGRGCELAVCYPAPFKGTCGPRDRAASVAALGQIWAKAGFRLWGDGVWMLDPRQRDSGIAVAELLAERNARK